MYKKSLNDKGVGYPNIGICGKNNNLVKADNKIQKTVEIINRACSSISLLYRTNCITAYKNPKKEMKSIRMKIYFRLRSDTFSSSLFGTICKALNTTSNYHS
jgi:hypothetical protein